MKKPDKKIIYGVVYFLVVASLLYFVKDIDKLDSPSPTYQEIMNADSTQLVNQPYFDKERLANDQAGNITLTYQPVSSLAQTYLPGKLKTAVYKLHVQEINDTPQLAEVRINRVKVSITNYYAVSKEARSISLRFKKNTEDADLKYFFANNEFGNYEDFCDENTLNIHVPPGTIHLFVRAINLKTHQASKYSKITVYSKTSVSKSFWFWPLMTIIALSPLLYYFYRLKINKQRYLLAEQKALEMQRYKITADLHDEIGSTLSSLQINSSVANFLFENNPEDARKILEKIESQSEHLSDKIGDIVWSMKPGKEEFLTLSTRIKNFANEILGSTNIQYSLDIDKLADTAVTDVSLRKNIILFAKEAINNAAKHSRAGEIILSLQFAGNNIVINISDNGVGFAMSDTTSSTGGGNGLGNMKNRIEEMGGILSIRSAPGEGTAISAVIPLSHN